MSSFPSVAMRLAGRPWRTAAASGLALLWSIMVPVALAATGTATTPTAAESDTTAIGYSALTQIDHTNTWRLEQVWQWPSDRPDATHADLPETSPPAGRPPAPSAPRLLSQAAGGALVFCTGGNRLHALDPGTGRERWQVTQPCTAVAGWHDRAAPPDSRPCIHRILTDSGDGHLLAADATTGKRCAGFGDSGRGTPDSPGATSGIAPLVVINDNVILAYLDDSADTSGQPGLMAIDAQTGARRWVTPLPGRMTGHRVHLAADAGDDLVVAEASGTVSALRAGSGTMLWQFRMGADGPRAPRHGASPPLLVDITRGHRRIPAVVLVSDQGTVISLDRTTGAPLSPAVAGNLAGPGLTPDDAWGLTFWDQAQCRTLLSAALENNSDHASGPAGSDGSWIDFPASANGHTRPGVAFDPVRNVLVADLSRVALLVAGKAGSAEGRVFLGPTGLPCTAPPWSILASVDLGTGSVRWTEPLDTLSGMTKALVRGSSSAWNANTGGSPLVTAGGLVFVATSSDQRLHGFDLESGRELWSTALPASTLEPPLTYQLGGRQYVVIGGGSRPADRYLLAYALPEKYLESGN